VNQVTIKDLLESGVHFGPQTRRWNPKMKKFIFTERNGIYIIDLQKTLANLQKAADAIREISAKGESILFVGTKPQAATIVKEEAQRSNQFFVTNRWLGGMLTNFRTIRQSVKRLDHLDKWPPMVLTSISPKRKSSLSKNSVSASPACSKAFVP